MNDHASPFSNLELITRGPSDLARAETAGNDWALLVCNDMHGIWCCVTGVFSSPWHRFIRSPTARGTMDGHASTSTHILEIECSEEYYLMSLYEATDC